jgi:hypothetical protein
MLSHLADNLSHLGLASQVSQIACGKGDSECSEHAFAKEAFFMSIR